MQQQYPLVFIYFSGRGKFQPVRNLVAYLGCKYYQLHLNNQETKKKIPENIKNSLKGIKIDINALPILVHKGNMICDTYPIISYICRNFCPDLFGKSIKQRVNQFLDRRKQLKCQRIQFLKEQPINLDIFAFLQSTVSNVSKSKEQCLKEKRIFYQKIVDASGFIKQLCEYIEKEEKQNTFILEDITILDFYFMEICLRMVGIFKDLLQKKYCALETFFKGIFNCEEKEKKSNSLNYISLMIKYLNFTRNLPFYKQNKQSLQQYSLICTRFSAATVEGFRKNWTEDSIFIK